MEKKSETIFNLPEYLKKRLTSVSATVEKKQAALKKSPAGELRINNRSKRTKFQAGKNISDDSELETSFYMITAASRPNGTYLHKNQTELIRQLAQKRYDREVLKACQAEQEAIEKCIKILPRTTGEMVYDMLGKEWKKLIEPDWLSDEEYALRWQQETYAEYQYETGNKVFKTNRGELVRSKSEKIIADLLDRHHIPYRYEAVAILKDRKEAAPDFTVLDVHRRRVFFWEHLGMMSDPNYCVRNIRKIKRYTMNGYYEGENIIYTFEAANEGLTTEYLEDIIQHYFL